MHSSWQGAMPEYVPGRDTFVEEDSVAMGYTLRQQGKVVLTTGAVTVRNATLSRACRNMDRSVVPHGAACMCPVSVPQRISLWSGRSH